MSIGPRKPPKRCEPSPRFTIKCVPIPEGGFIVCDNFARPVRLHAGGKLYGPTVRHQPHSRYYETRAEADALVEWLEDRTHGYPYNLLMAEWPYDDRWPLNPANFR